MKFRRPIVNLVIVLIAFNAHSAQAGTACSGVLTYLEQGLFADQPSNCSTGARCYTPAISGATFTPEAGCDPAIESCAITIEVPIDFAGNHQNDPSASGFLYSFATVTVTPSGGGTLGTCGLSGAVIEEDHGTLSWGITSSCSDLMASYTITATACPCVGFLCPHCPKETTQVVDFSLSPLCPPPPPPSGCPEDQNCPTCVGAGGGLGGSAGGGGGGASPPQSGPGALLRYYAGGVGHPTYPGSAGITAELGRYWSYEYAERIARDPDDSNVWLLTRYATFRRFTDLDMDGDYDRTIPSDEYRILTKTLTGWTLLDLDGTLMQFDDTGLWSSTTDRNGNAKTATRDGTGRLTAVSFPDGRSETFTYSAGGKLDSITEIGVDGTTSRTWGYTYTGQDLTRIDRPDGTAWVFLYDDPTLPGYMTRMSLESTNASERIAGSWAYDPFGNVVQMWKGAANFNDAGAVDRWSMSFDDPQLPMVTTVTDPMGEISTYTLGRDSDSRKPRLEQLEGSCPSCGTGPNSRLFYEDPAHPLRPTRQIDGGGTTTLTTYDANGQAISRVEALGTALERETTWQRDPTYPALITEIERPSTTGSPLDFRRTTFTLSGRGNATDRIDEGVEDGQLFSYTTSTTYSAEGQPEELDPPGYGTADLSTTIWDGTRGGLLPQSRTDPLVGATLFTFDPFNRRISTVDPNGVVSEIQYDSLNRVLFAIQKGATPTEDLITEQRYTVFGDLFQTVLPRGNVIEFGYDSVGRLTSIERKPDDLPDSHVERTFYTLDGFGHRVREELQSWSGTSWTSQSTTDYVYSTRCHLDQMIEAAGSPEQATTEYSYNCDGDLAQLWDPNHPSAGQTAAASMVYAYDSLNRLSTLSQPFGGAGGGQTITSYGYDVQDHLNSVTDAEGTITTHLYSDRDLMTSVASEVSGLTTHRYNEHSQLTETTDARGISSLRIVDELDRVTLVAYPNDTINVVYNYDDPLVPFSFGRLTRIERDGQSIDYLYDRFGRIAQEGQLTYILDNNGNRKEILYPGGVRALYTFDHADRHQTLAAEISSQGIQAIIMEAHYQPFGPLRQLNRGNGLVETRQHDSRYQPDRITVASPGGTLLDWDYATDRVGNITAIGDLLDPLNNRTYAYQDYQYFLTQGDGPWGILAWAYDKIGNRLSETRDGVNDIYQYLANAAATGNTAKIDQVVLGAGGNRIYTFDAAGNQTGIDENGDPVTYSFDDAGRMSRIDHPSAQTSSRMLYDGRSFLRQATGRAPYGGADALFCDGFESGDTGGWAGTKVKTVNAGRGAGGCFETVITQPTYSNDGLLYERTAESGREAVIYFNGLPVAQADGSGLENLSVDHLGTPLLLTADRGVKSWSGGFEPFGNDFAGAQTAGMFLRFPGQWEDAAWKSKFDVSYNVYRWYVQGTSRYSRVDPLSRMTLHSTRSRDGDYQYGRSQPTARVDPLGLCSPGPDMTKCLLFIFGESPTGVRITPKIKENSDWASTTRKNRIIPYIECGDFFSNPALILEEYYHVLRQWNTGRMTRISYLVDYARNGYQGSKYEIEAKTFVAWNLRDFKDCLSCPSSVPGGIGPGGVRFSGFPK